MSEYSIRGKKENPIFLPLKEGVLGLFQEADTPVGPNGLLGQTQELLVYLMQFYSLVRSQTLSYKLLININELLQLSRENSKGYV